MWESERMGRSEWRWRKKFNDEEKDFCDWDIRRKSKEESEKEDGKSEKRGKKEDWKRETSKQNLRIDELNQHSDKWL